MKVVILAGGRGTRLREQTESLPKPLVEVGGKPVLWHVMKIFLASGFDDFVLCLGHLGDRIKQDFVERAAWRSGDFTLESDPNSGFRIESLDGRRERWRVTFADTGLETNTGGRIKRVEKYVDGERFFATYADGVTDIALGKLLAFHRSHGKVATVTAVRPKTTFGILQLAAGDLVTRFSEKPQLEVWVNGGFFVFERRIFDYLTEGSVLESDPLEQLAAEGELVAYRHDGFWACMDTYKDTLELNALRNNGSPPWRAGWE
ncbi:MAG: glucose-1-phosphate cytidylyltransferase [Candidatus Rokubacteria bacterium]|nr:glucose-1-phosphate cytidylyltransferase [Candidatus Rokubacteria bacterium]